MTKASFRVEGMHCSSCGMLIDDALEELPGVKTSKTSVGRARTTVDYDAGHVDLAAIEATIAKLGFRATPR